MEMYNENRGKNSFLPPQRARREKRIDFQVPLQKLHVKLGGNQEQAAVTTAPLYYLPPETKKLLLIHLLPETKIGYL